MSSIYETMYFEVEFTNGLHQPVLLQPEEIQHAIENAAMSKARWEAFGDMPIPPAPRTISVNWLEAVTPATDENGAQS